MMLVVILVGGPIRLLTMLQLVSEATTRGTEGIKGLPPMPLCACQLVCVGCRAWGCFL